MSVALLGSGYWGKNIGRVLHEESLLYAVCDKNSEQAEKLSKAFRCPSLTLDEVLNSDCSAVAIALPAELHFEIARKCLLSGKHVFVEKPLALNTSHSLELVNLSNELGLQLMVGHVLQYHNCFKEFKELIKNNVFGELKKLEATRTSFGKIRSNENVMWSFAPHDISMVLSLVNSDIEHVTADGVAVLQDNVIDTSRINILFHNGINAEVLSSWLSPIKRQIIVATTSEALITFDDTAPWDQKLSVTKYGVSFENDLVELIKKDHSFINTTQNEPLKSELLHFWNVVCQSAENSISDGQEGLKVVEVLERADASMRLK